MEEVFKVLWLAVSLLITGVTLQCASAGLILPREVGRAQAVEQAAAAAVAETRRYNGYDNKTVYPQDIISLIVKERGTPEVHVQRPDGGWYTWTRTICGVAGGDYSIASVSSLLPVTGLYRGELVRDASGAIVIIKFTKVG